MYKNKGWNEKKCPEETCKLFKLKKNLKESKQKIFELLGGKNNNIFGGVYGKKDLSVGALDESDLEDEDLSNIDVAKMKKDFDKCKQENIDLKYKNINEKKDADKRQIENEALISQNKSQLKELGLRMETSKMKYEKIKLQ